jgi:hypothetical protein
LDVRETVGDYAQSTTFEPGPSLILQEAPPYALLVSPRAFCGKAGFISIVEIHSKSRNVF